MNKNCCVVVPIYRTELPEIEWNALKNNRTILSDYDFIAVSPEGLDLTPITELIDFTEIHYFNPSFFQSPQTYNKLLIDKQFWNSFNNYTYMLIAQLDVIIFKDELREWCEKGYDYIGAPWLNGFGGNNVLSQENIATFFQCSSSDAASLFSFFQTEGVIDEHSLFQDEYWKAEIELKKSPVSKYSAEEIAIKLDEIATFFHTFVGVGNGGLSLRNIKTCQNLLQNETVPAKLSLSTPQMESFPMMNHDLKRLAELSRMLHTLNEKVVDSLANLFPEDEYSETFRSLIGKYSPARAESIFELKRRGNTLLPQYPSLKPILEVLNQMRGDTVDLFLKNMIIPEDFFWGEIAPLFSSSYRVAPVEEAVAFSFECNPRYCYEVNDRNLPFGCHAWQLPQNRPFWENFLPWKPRE